jgi:hypothetical protein
MRNSLLFLALVSLSGCAPTQLKPQIQPSGMKTSTPVDLCIEYHRTRSAEPYAELKSRGTLSEDDRQAIEYLEPKIGMSTLGMYCLFGRPENANTTTLATGTRVQYIYCTDFAINPAIDPRKRFSAIVGENAEVSCHAGHFYVYTDDGIVSAMQNQPLQLPRRAR